MKKFKILTNLLSIALILWSTVLIIKNIFFYRLLSFIDELMLGTFIGNTEVYENNLSQFEDIINIIFLTTILTTLILSSFWLYHAHKNTKNLGATELKYSDGSCVWWYFVPFANFVMPYKTMKETWLASKNPQNWHSEKSTALLVFWWFFWVVSNLSSNILVKFFQPNEESIDSIIKFAKLSIGSNMIDLVSCILFLVVIRKIFKMQQEHTIQNKISLVQ